ncbi:MAG TPA: transcription antitermination factor NusB [Acidimicrobiales bacterium]
MPPDDPDDLGPTDDSQRTSGFDGIGTRREARERALGLLYEAEAKGESPAELLDSLPVAPEPFAAEIVTGVADYQDEIDALLRRFSKGWDLERMPAIDRALLRMGTFELAHTDVPLAAAISEAVELAKRYSTDDSHKFVNGMLSRIATEVRAGPA